MSQTLLCPQCGQAFPDEDYCPEHFLRLVPAPVPQAEPTPDSGPVAAPQSGYDPDPGPAPNPGPDAGPGQASPPPRVEDDPDAAEGATTSPEGETRLGRLMGRLKLRRVGDGAMPGREGTGPDGSAPARPMGPRSPLPYEVQEQGWRLAGPVQSSAAVDRWAVERVREGEPLIQGHFHRYRTGALTSAALYERLAREAGGTPGLARVWSHGTVDIDGARADYDLVSLPISGTELHVWLNETAQTEQRAWNLLVGLSELLRRLYAGGLAPLTFEPTQLLLTGAGEIWLTTTAALTVVRDSQSFRPDFERSALLPQGWSAPELTQQSLASDNAALFALGQVLATAVWGQACSIAELQTGAVPFQSLVDGRLARIMMGCLWPRPSERWTREDLFRALSCTQVEAMPAAPPWASLAPGASTTAFSFAGNSYWRLEDLLATALLPAHWGEARSQLEAILDWARGTAWAGQIKVMREALSQGRSLDWVLIALNRVVRPDAPLTWLTLDLSDEEAARSLVSLAQGALRGDRADAVLIRELFQADLRGAFVPTSPPIPISD